MKATGVPEGDVGPALRHRAKSGLRRPSASTRAALSISQSAGPRDALRRLADHATTVWPEASYVGVVVCGAQSSGRYYHVWPEAAESPFVMRRKGGWEATLSRGETVTYRGKMLDSALAQIRPVANRRGQPPGLAELTIAPLVAEGRVVGALAVGSSSAAAHRAIDPATIAYLAAELAPAMLPRPHRAHLRARPGKRLDLLARLLHDIRTPLAGIGLAAELMELDPPAIPAVILEAMRTHYADMLRYMIELEDFLQIDLAPRLPAAQSVSLSDALEVALWRVAPYTRRRRQEMLVTGSSRRAVSCSRHHLEQALTAAIFDVSRCSDEGATIRIIKSSSSASITTVITAPAETSVSIVKADLMDPYLRADPDAHAAGLMSLAAAGRAITHYGGTLTTSQGEAIIVRLELPVA